MKATLRNSSTEVNAAAALSSQPAWPLGAAQALIVLVTGVVNHCGVALKSDRGAQIGAPLRGVWVGGQGLGDVIANSHSNKTPTDIAQDKPTDIAQDKPTDKGESTSQTTKKVSDKVHKKGANRGK